VHWDGRSSREEGSGGRTAGVRTPTLASRQSTTMEDIQGTRRRRLTATLTTTPPTLASSSQLQLLLLLPSSSTPRRLSSNGLLRHLLHLHLRCITTTRTPATMEDLPRTTTDLSLIPTIVKACTSRLVPDVRSSTVPPSLLLPTTFPIHQRHLTTWCDHQVTHTITRRWVQEDTTGWCTAVMESTSGSRRLEGTDNNRAIHLTSATSLDRRTSTLEEEPMEENDLGTPASVRRSTIDQPTTTTRLALYLDHPLVHSAPLEERSPPLAVVAQLLRPQLVDPSPKSTTHLPPPPPPPPQPSICPPSPPTLNSPSCPPRDLEVVDPPKPSRPSTCRTMTRREAGHPRCSCAKYLGVGNGSRGVNISSDMFEVSTRMRSVSPTSLLSKTSLLKVLRRRRRC
jgi:hypothetical protein